MNRFFTLLVAVFICLNVSAQGIITTNTTSASTCDGMAIIANPPASPWTWVWKDFYGTLLQTGGDTLDQLCSSGVSYNVVFSASGFSDSTSYFYIHDNCYSFNASVGYGNTAEDGCTGYINTVPTGGVPPYSVQWSNGSTSTNDSLNQLCAGVYSFTYIDQQGCTDFGNITISVDSTLSGTMSIFLVNVVQDNILPGCTGSIAVQIEGGSIPYTYDWSNGESTSAIYDLCPGMYTLTVTDAAGDSLVEIFPINNAGTLFTQNPFPDSVVNQVLNLGVVEICSIDYPTVDTAWLYSVSVDSLNPYVTLTWAILDAIDTTFYSDSILIDSLSGVYQIIIGFYCSTRAEGDYIQINSNIYVGVDGIQTADIDENELNDVNIYPNPFSDELIIVTAQVNDYEISIMDVNGKIIHNELFRNTAKAHLSSMLLKDGIYFIAVKSGESVEYRKLLKH